ncbi:HD domain-containing protein, partial [bacterium]|nr:HD domain-containing protein [bacterium]
LHDIAKPQTRREKDTEKNGCSFYNHEILGAKITCKILKRLKFGNVDINKVSQLVKYHMFYYTDLWTDGAVRRFIKNVGLDILETLFRLREADRVGNGLKCGSPAVLVDFKDRIKKILEIDSVFKIKDLNINGNIVMEKLNLKPGPIIGEILNHLLELALDEPKINQPEILIEKAWEYYKKRYVAKLE